MSIASSLWGQSLSGTDRFSATAFDAVRVVAENIEAIVEAGYAAGTLSEVLFSRFIATSGQTVFTGPDLSGRPLQVPGPTAQVYVNQRRMTQSSQYVIEGNGAQIRFLGPLVAGAEVLVSNFAFAPDGSIYFDRRHSPAALIALTDAMGTAADSLDLTLAQSQDTLEGMVLAATSAAETAAADAAAAVAPVVANAIRAQVATDADRAEAAANTVTAAGTYLLTGVAGTPVAITANLPGVAIAEGVVVKLPVVATNTGLTRLTIGTDANRIIVDRTGANVDAGALQAGRTYTLRRVDITWKIEGGDVTAADVNTAVSSAVLPITPVQVNVTAASSALDRDLSRWTAAPVLRRITAAAIASSPPDVASPSTATAETVLAAGGVRLVWRDQSGEIRERFWNGTVWENWLKTPSSAALDAEAVARTAGDAANSTAIAAVNARVDGANGRIVELESAASTHLWRGDTAVAASMDGAAIWTVDAQGKHRLVLDDWTVADLESRLDFAAGGEDGGSAAPVSPDLLGPIDGWSVWEDTTGMLTFTANLWGDYPREYVMLPIAGSVPWINGRSAVPLHLVYGDEGAQGPVSVAELTHTHQVSTLADGAAQLGYEGAVPDAPASGIMRTGPRFASVAADRWLATQAVAKWALARSEAVTGATLANLATGQPLANLGRAVDQAALVLAPYGRTPFVEAVSILHGAGDDSTTYAADMVTLMGAVNLATGARNICLYQPSGTTDRSNFRSADGLVEAFRDKGTLPAVLVAPTYWCGIRAGTISGFTAESLTQLAELGVHAQNTAGWVPPLMFRAQRSGAIINLDFEVTPGRSLVAPTNGLTVQGATISSMAVVADPDTALMTRLQVTLSGVPAGAVTIRYGRSATGRVGGDMRDNWSAPSVTGGTLRNYATSFEAVV